MRQRPMRNKAVFAPSCLFVLAVTCVFAASFTEDASARPPFKNAIGVCGGVPQTLAIAYERSLAPELALRIHAGSAVFLSSAGARLQWEPGGNGLAPYLFAGVAAIRSRAEDFGDPEGTTSYLWFGPGASVRAGRWIFFAEASALLGGDDDKGLGGDWVFPFSPALAAGVMVDI